MIRSFLLGQVKLNGFPRYQLIYILNTKVCDLKKFSYLINIKNLASINKNFSSHLAQCISTSLKCCFCQIIDNQNDKIFSCKIHIHFWRKNSNQNLNVNQTITLSDEVYIFSLQIFFQLSYDPAIQLLTQVIFIVSEKKEGIKDKDYIRFSKEVFNLRIS